MIRTPDFVSAADLKAAVASLLKRGKGAEVREVKLETIREGDRIQMRLFVTRRRSRSRSGAGGPAQNPA